MNPIYDVEGQVVFVTGAAMGMGLAAARAFAQSGASVVLADLDGQLAAKEAQQIVDEGSTAIGVACDVTDESQVAAAVDRAVAEYGRLDMAVNNAGIQVPPSDAAEEPIENFQRVVAVNQFGVWASMKHELRVPKYPDRKIEIAIDPGLTDIVAERYDAGARFGDQNAKDMTAVRISGHSHGHA